MFRGNKISSSSAAGTAPFVVFSGCEGGQRRNKAGCRDSAALLFSVTAQEIHNKPGCRDCAGPRKVGKPDWRQLNVGARVPLPVPKNTSKTMIFVGGSWLRRPLRRWEPPGKRSRDPSPRFWAVGETRKRLSRLLKPSNTPPKIGGLQTLNLNLKP